MRFTKILDFLQSYFIYLLVFLPPLVFLPLWKDWYDLPKFLTIGLLAGIVIALTGLNAFLTSFKKIFWLPLVFLIITLLSTLFSYHKLTSLFPYPLLYLNNLFHVSLIVLVSLSTYSWLTSQRSTKLKNLTLYLVTGSLLVGIYSLIQLTWHWETIFQDYRSRGTIGEPNRLAFYLAATLPLAFSLALYKKPLKFLGIITALINLTVLLFTFSRGAWLALMVAMTTFILLYRKSLIKALKSIKLNLLFILGLAAIAFVIGSPLGKTSWQRLWAVKDDLINQKGSVYLRLASWQAGWQLFKDQSLGRQLVGLGPNVSALKLISYRDPNLNSKRAADERTWRTYTLRNQYLHHLLNTGILGLVSFLAIIFLTSQRFLLQITSPLERGFFLSFLVIAFSSFIYYQTNLTSLLFWIYLAILGEQFFFTPKKLGKIISITLIICGFLIVGSTAVYGIADYSASRNNFSLATKLLPWQDEYWEKWSRSYSIKASQTKSKNDFDQAIAYSQKALTINSLEVDNLDAGQLAFYRAGVFLDKTYHQQALKMGIKRTKMDPARAAPFDDLGLIYLDLGKLDQALENFLKALKLDPDHLTAYLHAGEAYKQKQNFTKAKKYYQKALKLKPDYSAAQIEMAKLKGLMENSETSK